MIPMFDWNRILFNDAPGSFLLEVAVRSTIMFLGLLLVLKIAGKRGIKQLSIFEMVIIISLGSAAGDPMFYDDVGIFHAFIVFVVVMLLYRLITWLTGKSPFVEKLFEGKTECLIDEGKFSMKKFRRESLAQDEFFAELRLRNVEHLGQVRKAYLETSGDISVFFYPDDAVKEGLSILPELFQKQVSYISASGTYCCCRCGEVKQLTTGAHSCFICQGTNWVVPIYTKRTT
ncbi:DUF421 domain-containing protein [Pseudochryseolinea flava]|uniref:DUF421 domain-containing protein n=1 Tax=Pseudochryseolinea flava TaxID=2059302 RepID=A0A364Y6T2_9BACT|nr:DUF421 domain-containing protein [Pseudochryseolinea flava]RAW02613.1 DUF421 domain-containing protein [Pseudochryseolinea flava]